MIKIYNVGGEQMAKVTKYFIGEIRCNKFGQEYTIIEKAKGGRIIRFTETGTERKVGHKELSNGNIVDENNRINKSPEDNARTFKLGEKYFNKDGYEFEITKILPCNERVIKFTMSGYETKVNTERIKKLNIKDRLSPSVVGGGIIGTEIRNPQTHPLYDRWWHMLDRCYNAQSSRYSLYGGKGVYVCDEWKFFPNYVKDISSKENYDKLLKNPTKWDIDKDILTKDNKCYSNSTTLIVEKRVNIGYKNSNCKYVRSVSTHQFSINGEYVKSYKSRSDAYREVKGIKDICAKANTTSIKYCEKGYKYNTAHGFKWVSDEDFKKYGIEEISNQIKKGER